jgi:hypothetical protein
MVNLGLTDLGVGRGIGAGIASGHEQLQNVLSTMERRQSFRLAFGYADLHEASFQSLE